MSIVPTDVPMTAELAGQTIQTLAETYPFLRTETVATTAFGRPIRAVTVGTGPRRVLYSGAHHANEWLTATVLLKFIEDFAAAIESGGTVGGTDARELARTASVSVVPMVNPDGVDLVTGALTPGGEQYEQARALSRNYPNIPFPEGWKANLNGVDLNLQYPAGWLMAREIKFSQGFTQPGPRDYVGRFPLSQIESQALYDYTERLDPSIVIAWHSQGEVIYWQYGGIEVEGARELAERFAEASGYALEDTPYASSFAGYKDWFIQAYRRPGFTVEVGTGTNPLPLSQFDDIYRASLPILVIGAMP
ncbi:MAG: gamma-D-glutamyl-meso-diaminopimelate peptidase [Oscillospiraceae bacterium]|nr:gamma-D-glutamyl-meso-diaminopimelate peptidase [Oscillospiraceae bacterium]